MTDTLLSRSLNQSYRQISVKNFNKTFSSNLPWGQNGECLSQVYLSVFMAIKRWLFRFFFWILFLRLGPVDHQHWFRKCPGVNWVTSYIVSKVFQWYSPLTEACITQFQWLWVKYILIKMCKKWYPTEGLNFQVQISAFFPRFTFSKSHFSAL